jgi:hypothetical protein
LYFNKNKVNVVIKSSIEHNNISSNASNNKNTNSKENNKVKRDNDDAIDNFLNNNASEHDSYDEDTDANIKNKSMLTELNNMPSTKSQSEIILFYSLFNFDDP